MVGHRIIAIRQGRVLLLDLDDEQHLLVHPKMTGQLAVIESGTTGFVAGHEFPEHARPDVERVDSGRLLAQRGGGAVLQRLARVRLDPGSSAPTRWRAKSSWPTWVRNR